MDSLSDKIELKIKMLEIPTAFYLILKFWDRISICFFWWTYISLQNTISVVPKDFLWTNMDCHMQAHFKRLAGIGFPASNSTHLVYCGKYLLGNKLKLTPYPVLKICNESSYETIQHNH